jgi:hypothetical protein
MYLNLTTQIPLFVPTLCSHSLVIRTAARLTQGEPLLGMGHLRGGEDLRLLPPSASKKTSDSMVYETFLPLSGIRRGGCLVCFGSGCRQCPPEIRMARPWRVHTLVRKAAELLVPVQMEVRVQRPGGDGVYLATVVDVGQEVDIAATLFRLDTLSPLASDVLPLHQSKEPCRPDVYAHLLND